MVIVGRKVSFRGSTFVTSTIHLNLGSRRRRVDQSYIKTIRKITQLIAKRPESRQKPGLGSTMVRPFKSPERRRGGTNIWTSNTAAQAMIDPRDIMTEVITEVTSETIEIIEETTNEKIEIITEVMNGPIEIIDRGKKNDCMDKKYPQTG